MIRGSHVENWEEKMWLGHLWSPNNWKASFQRTITVILGSSPNLELIAVRESGVSWCQLKIPFINSPNIYWVPSMCLLLWSAFKIEQDIYGPCSHEAYRSEEGKDTWANHENISAIMRVKTGRNYGKEEGHLELGSQGPFPRGSAASGGPWRMVKTLQVRARKELGRIFQVGKSASESSSSKQRPRTGRELHFRCWGNILVEVVGLLVQIWQRREASGM